MRYIKFAGLVVLQKGFLRRISQRCKTQLIDLVGKPGTKGLPLDE